MHRPVHVDDSHLGAEPYRYSNRVRLRVRTTGSLTIDGNLLEMGDNEILVPEDIVPTICGRVAPADEVAAAEAHSQRLIGSWNKPSKLPPYSMQRSYQELWGKPFSGILSVEVVEDGIPPRLSRKEMQQAQLQRALEAVSKPQRGRRRKGDEE